MNKQNKIYILCGKSSAGKDTLAGLVKERLNLNFLISHSTRPMRENESEGNPYYFIDKKQFIDKVFDNDFIEYRSYTTNVNNKEDIWYYGLSKDSIKDDESYVGVLDIQGLKDFKRVYKDRVVSIYIEALEDTRTQRAMCRGSFNLNEWNRRLKADEKDFKDTYEVCDYVIHNDGDNIEIPFKNIYTIIRGND